MWTDDQEVSSSSSSEESWCPQEPRKETTHRSPREPREAPKDVDSSLGEREPPDGMWLVDTGSGHDLITPDVADGHEEIPVDRVTFHTAGGRVRTKRALTRKSTNCKVKFNLMCFQVLHGCSLWENE